MPHVIVKLYAGKSEQQKKRLAERRGPNAVETFSHDARVSERGPKRPPSMFESVAGRR
ncbi:MAG TPA: hypothetical protein VHC69_34990 [Polyangiaceae bacterium]|nr:hypothetical protein [Polyangiaceae bacterium]